MAVVGVAFCGCGGFVGGGGEALQGVDDTDVNTCPSWLHFVAAAASSSAAAAAATRTRITATMPTDKPIRGAWMTAM